MAYSRSLVSNGSPSSDSGPKPSEHPTVARVVSVASELGLAIAPVRFPDETRTAADAAAAIGVSVSRIVKSLVFAVGDGSAARGAPDAEGESAELVMAFVGGDRQLDVIKLARAAGATKAWRVDADAVRAATGFAVGGVPPLGHSSKLRLFVDPGLLAFEEVWAAAGTPRDVFAMPPNFLVTSLGATVIDLAI